MAISAPSSLHTSSLAGEPAVTATRLPSARAIWMACVPIPLAPPWINTTWPADRSAVITKLDHTVHVTSGRAAAW
jgi:hypothetical protein